MSLNPKFAKTQVQITIPFHDNDPMGIVWHGNYYKYFEIARDALLERINFTIPMMKDLGFGLPVIESQCKYRHYIQYLQTIEVIAYLSEWENRVVFNFEIHDPKTQKVLAKGHTIHAAYNFEKKELLFLVPECFQQAILKTIKSDGNKENAQTF